jgi:RNA polymerase-binding transcription factor DksA
MNTNAKHHLIEIPVGGNGGLIWNRLHSEREDICEAITKESQSMYGVESSASTRNWHRELLQARLRIVDEALDRLMSGSYGHCSNCGKWIGDDELALDPATSKCLVCSKRKDQNGTDNSTQELIKVSGSDLSLSSATTELTLETLQPFDTILVRTLKSDYRILLLDPKTGRALVEGGQYLTEPRESLISGSNLHDSPFKPGSIAVGYHLVMWADEKIVNTSRVQSISIRHHYAAESIEDITEAVH